MLLLLILWSQPYTKQHRQPTAPPLHWGYAWLSKMKNSSPAQCLSTSTQETFFALLKFGNNSSTVWLGYFGTSMALFMVWLGSNPSATIWFFSLDTVRDPCSGLSDLLQDDLFFRVGYCLCNFGLCWALMGMSTDGDEHELEDSWRFAKVGPKFLTLYEHPWKHPGQWPWLTFSKEQAQEHH